MLSLFYKKNDVNYSMIHGPKLEYIRNNIHSILYILNSYYKDIKGYVRRPNMLVSLLESLDIDPTLEPDVVYGNISSDSIYLASNFNIINGVKTDDVFNKDTVIYNTKEIFIYNNDNFNFLDESILDIPSVECIWSNNTDLFLTHPKNYKGGVYDFDMYEYTINIDMLAMQYYYWMKEQKTLELDLDPARFIHDVVLTNTIKSIFNINYINRIIAIANDEFVNPFTNDNPFFIKDISKKIDSMILWYLKNLRKKKDLYYKEILTILPILTGGSVLDTLTLSELYLNRRTKWVYILARLDIVNFLLYNFKSKKEKHYHNDIMSDFSYMVKNKYLITNNETINSVLEKKEDKLKQYLFL